MMACDAQPSSHAYFAVLGVISHEASPFRNAVRTWLHAADEDDHSLLARLVLRGLGASALVRREAIAFNDTVFLHAAPGSLPAAHAALENTLLWFACAVGAWPQSTLVGRAEDDVWLHLPDIVGSLRDMSASFVARGVPDLLWGVTIDARHAWNRTTQQPQPVAQEWATGRQTNAVCRDDGNSSSTTTSLSGPFPSARGGVFFLSSTLAARISLDAQLSPIRAAALSAAATAAASAATKPHMKPHTRTRAPVVPDDAWVGYALSQLHSPVPRLAVVGLPREQLVDQFGFVATRRAVVWRAKHRVAARLASLQQWSEAQHCDRPRRPRQAVRQRGARITPSRWLNDCAENRLRHGSGGGGGGGGGCAAGAAPSSPSPPWWWCVDNAVGDCGGASNASSRINLKVASGAAGGLPTPSTDTKAVRALHASLPLFHPTTLPIEHPAVQRHRCSAATTTTTTTVATTTAATRGGGSCRGLDDDGPFEGGRGAHLSMAAVLVDQEERQATAAAFLEPALSCLRRTTPGLELSYPADAWSHYLEVRSALRRWWWAGGDASGGGGVANGAAAGEPVPQLREAHGQAFMEVEDAWHAHVQRRIDAALVAAARANRSSSRADAHAGTAAARLRTPPAPRLHDVSGPYVPLLICWWCMQLVHDKALLKAMRRVLRPSVAYVTLAVADDGISGTASRYLYRGTPNKSRDHAIRMRDFPNVLVLSGGGYGQVPYPPLKNPPAPLAGRVPVADRPLLVSSVGNLAHGPPRPPHDTLRKRVRQAVAAEAARPAPEGGGFNYSFAHGPGTPWRELLGSARASLAPRGNGRSTFLLAEIVNLGLVPIHVFSDVPFVPYADLFAAQLGFVSDVAGLPTLLRRLRAMPAAQLEAREAAAAQLSASHFTLPGVLEQIERFLLAPATSDLRCQRLPPTPRDMAW